MIAFKMLLYTKQVQVQDAFHDLCREVLLAKRKSKQSFIEKIDRMLSGTRAYNRGKSDSALPKD
jgi:Ras-like protein family member 11A